MIIDLSSSTSPATRAFLLHVLEYARAHGMDQTTLAARAGISPESLSRLKRAGRCRLITAFDLARAAGLTRIELRPPPATNVAAAIAASKLSAGRRRAVTGAELAAALSATDPPAQFRPHVYGFFEELPIESVHDVVLEEHLGYAKLYELATSLGAEGETVDWIAEMAGDRLAPAA
jgi:hypothetical protein